MLSSAMFIMFINLNKVRHFKIVLLTSCLTFCLNSQAANFYVGVVYTPLHYSGWAWGGGTGEGYSADNWYPFGTEVRLGIEQKLLHLDESDPEWGHADLGIGARVFASVVLTDQEYIGTNEGGTNFTYGFEPYLYFTPSSQLGLKLYVGNGLVPDDLTYSTNSFFWGLAFPLSQTNEFSFDMRMKDSGSDLADASFKSTSYNLGVSFKF